MLSVDIRHRSSFGIFSKAPLLCFILFYLQFFSFLYFFLMTDGIIELFWSCGCIFIISTKMKYYHSGATDLSLLFCLFVMSLCCLKCSCLQWIWIRISSFWLSSISGICTYRSLLNFSYDADFCSGKPDGNFEDPLNCYDYYQCSNTATYHITCPAGLAWCQELDLCDYGGCSVSVVSNIPSGMQ